MSKVVVALVAGSGATVASVGGIYILQKGSGTEEGNASPKPDSDSSTPKETSSSKNLDFDTVELFKAGMKNSDCVNQGYFGEITDKSDATEIGTGSPDDNSFFKTTASGITDTYKSCLFINGKVTSYSDDKWNGKFTWLWTFLKGDEGFITFNVAESFDQENGKLKFTGIFYLVGKKVDETDKWEIKYQKKVGDNVTAGKNDLDSYFPKIASDLKTSGEGDYWDFISERSKWENSCKISDCGTPNAAAKFLSKKLSFAKEDGQTKKPIDWSSDFSWWTKLYSGISWSLQDRTNSFTGKWTVSST